MTILNRSALKNYALIVSSSCRAGKFTRVGLEFVERCETRLESEIRALGAGELPVPCGGLTFVTKTARAKAEEKLEALAQRIIYSEVMKHPSLGVTLK